MKKFVSSIGKIYHASAAPVLLKNDFVKCLEGEWNSENGISVTFEFDNETEWRFTSEWEKDGDRWWGATIPMNNQIVTSLLPDFECEPVTCGVVSYLKQHNVLMAYWTEKGFIQKWPATGVAVNSENNQFEGYWDMNYLFYGVDETPGNLFQLIKIEKTGSNGVYHLEWSDEKDSPLNLMGFGVEVEENVLCAAWGSVDIEEQNKMGLVVLDHENIGDGVMTGYCVCGETKEINQLSFTKK